MRKLDYRPNRVARALVTGRSRTLGVVSFDTTLFGPASTLAGIERAAHDAGYSVSIASASLELTAAPLHRAIDRLREQGVDGVLVIAPQESAARALHRLPHGLPVVATEAGTQDDVPLVAVDQRAGADGRDGAPARRSGTAPCWHVSGPPDWLEAQDRVRRLARHADAAAGAGARRCWRATGALAPGTRSPGGCPPTRPPCSPATTRWRSGVLRATARARPPGAGGGQRRRLRRHPRGGVLHAAADDRAPALRRGRPAGAARAAGPDRRRRSGPATRTTIAPELVVRASTAAPSAVAEARRPRASGSRSPRSRSRRPRA